MVITSQRYRWGIFAYEVIICISFSKRTTYLRTYMYQHPQCPLELRDVLTIADRNAYVLEHMY